MRIPSIRILSLQTNVLSEQTGFRVAPGITLTGEIDQYTSLLFTRSWQGVGEWEFHMMGTNPIALKEGNLIILDSDGRRAGIIRSVNIANGSMGLETTVRGQTLNSIAAQRCTIPLDGAANGGYDTVPALESAEDNPDPVTAETILKTYASRHLINPLDEKRRIPLMSLAPDLQRGASGVWMSRYEQLDSVLQSVSEYLDTGWEIYLDLDKRQMIFDVLPGVNRSVGQSENSRVIFSIDYESVENLEYLYELGGYRNLAYAGGAGENENRLVLKITNEPAEPIGLARFETFLDCGVLEITETDTALSLTEEGLHKLKEYKKTESLTAAIVQPGSFVYRRQWDLGDLVTVVDRTAGVEQDLRISQVTERYEAQSMGIDVTFGTPPDHLGRMIRKLKTTVK